MKNTNDTKEIKRLIKNLTILTFEDIDMSNIHAMKCQLARINFVKQRLSNLGVSEDDYHKYYEITLEA